MGLHLSASPPNHADARREGWVPWASEACPCFRAFRGIAPANWTIVDRSADRGASLRLGCGTRRQHHSRASRFAKQAPSRRSRDSMRGSDSPRRPPRSPTADLPCRTSHSPTLMAHSPPCSLAWMDPPDRASRSPFRSACQDKPSTGHRSSIPLEPATSIRRCRFGDVAPSRSGVLDSAESPNETKEESYVRRRFQDAPA